MHKVMLYALSTCGWCKRARQFLDDHSVVYECTYVDKLQGEERRKAMIEVKHWNARESFPTLVIDDSRVIVGFQEDTLREALGL